ncbi:MAG: ornithine carbamoyltransferase [Mycoplasmatales bacterium]
MAVNIKGRHFLKVADFSTEELTYLLELSKQLKNDKFTKREHKSLVNKNVVLLFQKDSTRTRCAFEVGAMDQGANVTYLGPNGSHMGTKESIADTARVLSRMYDGIEFRGNGHELIEELAEFSHVPVWNGLTDGWHPTQMLADYLTIYEQRGSLKGIKFAYMGDARNNMSNSYIIMAAKFGVDMRIGAPKSLWPSEEVLAMAKVINEETGGSLLLTDDPCEAVKGANVITTDVWVSMGEDKSVWKERIELLKPYQVNKTLVSHADEDYIFIHCLPAFHNSSTDVGKSVVEEFGFGSDGLEVTDEIFESKHSHVFSEAENRLHTIKAVMVATIGDI